MDRKEIVKTLGEYLGVTPKYLGPQSFAYEIKTEDETYIIGREGNINTFQGRVVTLDDIINSIDTEEKASGTFIDGLELKLPFDGHTGRTLINVINMLYSKQQLLIKALELTEPFMVETFVEVLNSKKPESLEELKTVITETGPEGHEGLSFDFEEGTFTFKLSGENLSPEKIDAFKELAVLINENAMKLKHTSFKQAQEDNPRYAFRTWLIRLGMNGDEYKAIRKTLLSNLEGSGAFRKVPEERGSEVDG